MVSVLELKSTPSLNHDGLTAGTKLMKRRYDFLLSP